MKHTDIDAMRDNKMVNFSFVEDHRTVDKSEGTFINKGETQVQAECILVLENERAFKVVLL